MCFLKGLTLLMLGVSIQEGEHNSVQDAQAAMSLYTLQVQWEWEVNLLAKFFRSLDIGYVQDFRYNCILR